MCVCLCICTGTHTHTQWQETKSTANKIILACISENLLENIYPSPHFPGITHNPNSFQKHTK